MFLLALQLLQTQVFSTIKSASFLSFQHFKHLFLTVDSWILILMAISITTSIKGRKLVFHIFVIDHAEDWKAVNTKAEIMKNGSYLVTQEGNSSSVTRGTQVVAFLLCLICMCHNKLDHATNMLCNHSESSTILQEHIQKNVQRLSLHWWHKISKEGTVFVVKDT